jgi:glutamate-1-semialdehyde 2,1-aminomutase
MENKCKVIAEQLKKVIREANLKLQVNHIASMFQLFFTSKAVYDYASVKTADNTKYLSFHKSLLAQGVFLPPSQFETCFLSAVHSDDDLNKTIECFTNALQ